MFAAASFSYTVFLIPYIHFRVAVLTFCTRFYVMRTTGINSFIHFDSLVVRSISIR